LIISLNITLKVATIKYTCNVEMLLKITTYIITIKITH